jgi:hypothetical protein
MSFARLVPFTASFSVGFGVPIPTFPFEAALMARMPGVGVIVLPTIQSQSKVIRRRPTVSASIPDIVELV